MLKHKERLQKVLADLGLGSRREIERWIEAGRIRIGGKIATLGVSLDDRDRTTVTLDGKPIPLERLGETKRVLLYHKPPGEICSRKDEKERKTVFDALPPLRNKRWIIIGRLDMNTSGLLLFTTDGTLANHLMHPSSNLEREYSVRLLGNVSEAAIERLKRGVTLEDGRARFESIEPQGGTGANKWYNVIVKEGKNRLVRRLWESQGIKVSRLMRIRFGPVTLPRLLKMGAKRELTPREVSELYHAVGLD